MDDKTTRWKKVKTQFNRRGIEVDRFSAVDGRCKGKKRCAKKIDEFEEKYDVEIDDEPKDMSAPAASLVIGTIEILRKQVENKWKRVLICEDDIVLGKSLVKKFSEGITEMKKLPTPDLLYLGCGADCGSRGMSAKKTKSNKYISDVYKAQWCPDKFYTIYKDDLRSFCKPAECKPLSSTISLAPSPGGTWCYSYTLEGAKKMLKLLGDRPAKVDNHIDNIIRNFTKSGDLLAYAFDPPIVWHEGGSIRPDSDIPLVKNFLFIIIKNFIIIIKRNEE